MRPRLLALLVLALLLAVACGNAEGGGGGSAETQGISDKEIKVGGLAAKTGPLAAQYAPVFAGAKAYLDMINEQGGVNGRTIKLVAERDDATNPARDVAQARALVQQDKVFAVLPVAVPIFSGGKFLSDNEIPTFGWNVNAEWNAGPTMFGEKGSALDFTAQGPEVAFLAKKEGAQKAATIAYTVQQSADCATGQVGVYDRFGIPAFKDTSLQFGAQDISGDIQRLKDFGSQFVSTCMDPSGNVLVSRNLKRAGLTDVGQFWPNGYDQGTLDQYQDLMEGVYFRTDFVPFEAADKAPGLQRFLSEMRERSPGTVIGEVALAGWLNADLFVRGLVRAGKEVTRSKLVDAINGFRNWKADGILDGVDWTVAHEIRNDPACSAFIQVQQGRFVAVFGENGSAFVCWDDPKTRTSLDTATKPSITQPDDSGAPPYERR